MSETAEIAKRIAGLRDACGYTAEQMAKKLSVPAEVYAGYERNGDDIPISVIYQIAGICGVDFTEIITGTAAKLSSYHIVRKGEGQPIDRYPGYRFEDLAFRYNHKIMQPLLVVLDPSDEPAKLVKHAGQEFNYVISGSITLVFGDREFTLNAGDSVYFNPTEPHGQRCCGSEKAAFLTVITQ